MIFTTAEKLALPFFGVQLDFTDTGAILSAIAVGAAAVAAFRGETQ